MKDFLALAIGAVILGFGMVYAYHHYQAVQAASQSSQTVLQAQGLTYNPFQDATNLQGSSQETVNPLTGELTLTPGISLNSTGAATAISGQATGVSSVT